MRIALTHNLQRSADEAEAEFDTPQTIEALVEMLGQLGHEVHAVDVGEGLPALVRRLEELSPDLVFNTAEGQQGRAREAAYPALLEAMGLPYTASDGHVCAVTLDKHLTKLVVAAAGVRTPAARLIQSREELEEPGVLAMRFPVIVKPNYEGSSKGIDQGAVVDSPEALRRRVREQLPRYPSGLLVEEFIAGRDVTVPWLERHRPETGGVLAPAEYVFDEAMVGSRQHQIYDYRLKSELSAAVSVRVPASLEGAQVAELEEMSRRVVRALGIRDVARLDFRVDERGEPHFIEVNALPSFEPGASLYVSAAASGLAEPAQVLATIVGSAWIRHRGSAPTSPSRRPRRPSRRRRVRVGLLYNLKRIDPTVEGEDRDAEFDAASTIDAVARAIESHGCEVVRLEATPDLVNTLPRAGIDVGFNIAEGLAGRSREAQVPALLELIGIEYTGSDPAALSLTLDKGLAKRVVAQAGVPTPGWATWRRVPRKLPDWIEFPLMVKPVAEGSSKGVVARSVVRDEAELRGSVDAIVAKYRQPALVERFLSGREFTIGLLGGVRPTVLPPMEIVFTDPAVEHPIYSFEHKIAADAAVRYEVPASVDPPLARELASVARRAYTALGCRDVGRVDIRLDAAGHANFIECNPLPGLTPEWSDLCMIATAAGMTYDGLIGAILHPALRRAGLHLALRRAGLDDRRRTAAEDEEKTPSHD